MLDQYRPQARFAGGIRVLDRLGLAEILDRRGIGHFDHDALAQLDQARQCEMILAADIGITSATSAIAETGSLVMMSAPGANGWPACCRRCTSRSSNAAQIMPDLFDLFAELKRAGYDNLPSNLALITGPSKTGDIEMTLTTGVHGPGKWHVIVVR